MRFSFPTFPAITFTPPPRPARACAQNACLVGEALTCSVSDCRDAKVYTLWAYRLRHCMPMVRVILWRWRDSPVFRRRIPPRHIPEQKTNLHSNLSSDMQENTHVVRKSASQAVLIRMKLTLRAIRRTPHGASRSMQAVSALLVKTLRVASRLTNARVYGLETTAMHEMSTPPPSPFL